MLGTTQGFFRAVGEARLTTPLRSAGGHRHHQAQPIDAEHRRATEASGRPNWRNLGAAPRMSAVREPTPD
jgi:hypothetical protein